MGDNNILELQKHKSISYTRVVIFLVMAAEVVKILKNGIQYSSPDGKAHSTSANGRT